MNPPDLWFVISLAILWYFGSEIERLLGRDRFAILLLLVTVIPGIVGALIKLPEFGIRPIEMAVFLLFVAEYPYVRLFFGIPASVTGAVILGIEVLQLLGAHDYGIDSEERILFLFVTLAVTALTARTMGLLSNLPWVPALPIGDNRPSGRGGRSRQRAWQPHQPGRRRGRRSVDGEPRRSKGHRAAPQPPVSSADAARDQAELDCLLDKISENGMDGLSADEKRRLNELSKRMRGRR